MTEASLRWKAGDLVRSGEELLAEGRPEQALGIFSQALARGDTDHRALSGRARALMQLRRIEAARTSFVRAIEHGADPGELAQDRWMAAMLCGDFAEAWQVSDAVLRHRPRAALNRRDQPFHLRHVWDGSPLDGKDVLVRCYHGLGDTIQFIRYVPLLRRIARSVTVQAVAPLHPILSSIPAIDRLVPLGYDIPDPPFEVDIELMELPHAFRTALASIPADVPYLRAARRRAMPATPGLKVGLAWAAGEWDCRRSVPLAALAPLAELPGVALFNLQRGPALADLHKPGALRFADASRDWSDDILETAVTMRALDLVVTVDTMVAHLAGALGVEVWTLLHFAADWRWMLDRADSPWYPTMRLFRQSARGEWAPVIAQVAAALGARVRRGAAQ